MWPRGRIEECIHRWAEEHGQAPISADWEPRNLRRMGMAGFPREYPSSETVKNVTGMSVSELSALLGYETPRFSVASIRWHRPGWIGGTDRSTW